MIFEIYISGLGCGLSGCLLYFADWTDDYYFIFCEFYLAYVWTFVSFSSFRYRFKLTSSFDLPILFEAGMTSTFYFEDKS